MKTGAFQEILQQRFNIGQVVSLNHVTQFRVDKNAQIVFLIFKHNEDDRRDSRHSDAPPLRPVLQGAELRLGDIVLFATCLVHVHWPAVGPPPSYRGCSAKGLALKVWKDTGQSLGVPTPSSNPPAVPVPVARVDRHTKTPQSAESCAVLARIRSGRCVGQGSGMPRTAAAVPLWDRRISVRDR